MAEIPKTISLTAISVSTDFGTVPANAAWIILDAQFFGTTVPGTGRWGLAIGGDDILEGNDIAAVDQSASAFPSDSQNRKIIAEAGEVVRAIELVGTTAVNARLSYIEVDV